MSYRSMALSENQKLFFSLINEYAAEKKQEDQRVVVLKKRIEELRSELEATNVELENVKRAKETTEQELKGCEVELSLNETSIQTLEARISVLQGEIASVGSELDSLKCEENVTRDQFINHLFGLSKKIRKFQDQLYMKNVASVGNATEASHEPEEDSTKTSSQSVEERLIKLVTQITYGDEEHLTEEQFLCQNRQALIHLEKRKAAMVKMVKGRKDLEVLTKQTSGLEMTYGHISEELLKSCICPYCFKDNTEALDNIPQVNEAN